MGLRTDTRTIDGIDVTTTQLDPLAAFALMAKLGKVLGPAMAMLEGVAMGSDVSALAPALGVLFSRLSEEDAHRLPCEILRSSRALVDGKLIELSRPEAINLAFSGRTKTMLLACMFALEVTFADFFDGEPAAQSAGSPKQASA